MRYCILWSLAVLLSISDRVIAQEVGEAVAFAWTDSCMIDPDHHSGPDHFSTLRLPPCSPTATNDNFSGAITLTLNAPAVAGTTCGSLETNEKTACNGSADQTVWYKFAASTATTYVQIINSGSCYIGSSIWPGNGLPTDLCTLVNCQAAANGPGTTLYQINTVAGRTYAVQITYSSGAVCGSAGSFTISASTTNPGGTVSNPPPPTACNAASPGCYMTTPPASATAVTTACTGYPLVSQTNLVVSGLYSFHTAATNSIQLSNQIVLNSTCVNGNIAWGYYKIYDINCNVISCGNIAGGNLSNVACNTTYFIQYMWEELGCTYNTMWPYQYIPAGTVGCGTLPVDLISFEAWPADAGVELRWTTAHEFQNDYFTVERSIDGSFYEPVGTIDAAGTSNERKDYSTYDHRPFGGRSYYRLRQTDVDGAFSFSEPVSVDFSGPGRLHLFPNPAHHSFRFKPLLDVPSVLHVSVIDAFGSKKSEQLYPAAQPGNMLEYDISQLSPGIYTVLVDGPSSHHAGRIVIK